MAQERKNMTSWAVRQAPPAGAHDTRISVVKAICIILMVVGHTACPETLNNWLVNFRMPAFFFVSGFLLKQKYFSQPKEFVKRRFKGLWWPFVKWSLIFLALYPLMYDWGLYATPLSAREMAVKVPKILIMIDSVQLLGGFWFLKALLYSSVIGFFLVKLVRGRLRWVSAMVVMCLILAYLFSIFPRYTIPTVGSIPMLATAFYLSGYVFRNLRFSNVNLLIPGLIATAVGVAISFRFSGCMQSEGAVIFTYYFVAMIATYGLVNLAGFITGSVLRCLDWIGRRTFHILALHFSAFKVVTLGYIFVGVLESEHLAQFPTPGNVVGG